MGFVDDVIMGEPGSSKIDISALVIDLSEQLPIRNRSCEFGAI